LRWSGAAANDDFANAQQLTDPSGSVDGTTFAATLEEGEPTADASVANTVWYAWTAPGPGPVTFTYTSAFAGSLNVFTRKTRPALAFAAGFADDTQRPASSAATAGTTYFVQVGSYDDLPGPFTLDFAFTQTTPTIADQAPQTVSDTTAPVAATI